MLDTETKRRIDTARNQLVGKVPDPKSQVEQITIALIYKFMDDMDAESEELGGKRKFFSGEFDRYSWKKLLAPDLGGFDVLSLYAEAIQKMNINPNIPQLFRDIFKNAYLPYRDPETLKSFLKIIDDFEYDHSERLGDAFEYLLSVLGSQGDAGQFRTPRHIIDFMVELIDPKKNETILDPACGTAGFLISSYKHIVKNNSSSYNPKKDNSNGNGDRYNGDKLTPDERKKLAVNIKGFDISPDMVRLSLVNLYLHGFNNPLIFEYDTLTSDDKWNEFADVILANPPFMSPKGGIKPHKNFSVESSRSEVLFVDYIAEHLTPNGRGAVIVPEGIIFQSGTAYKSLRKMLVEKYLYAVVSLPGGVFNPYSGVKTSILLMDKTLARRTDKILFAKIDNDGFDLGAQRRANDKGEIPNITLAIKTYIRSVIDNNQFESDAYNNIVLVPKEKIGENEEWNLSVDRYRTVTIGDNSKYPLVAIGDICQFEYGKPLKKEDRIIGDFPVYGSNGIVDYHKNFLVREPFIVVGRKGSAGEVHYSSKNGFPIDTTFYIKLENEDKVELKYLFHILKSADLKNVNTQAGVPGLNRNDAYKIQIPLPPVAKQKEIVAEIEGWQKIIDGARQVVENYKPQLLIDPSWTMVELDKAAIIISGYGFDSKDFSNVNTIKCIKITNVGVGEFIPDSDNNLPPEYSEIYKAYSVNTGDIVISLTRPIISSGLKVSVIPEEYNGALVNQRVAAIKGINDISNPKFIYYYLCSPVAYDYVLNKSRSLMQPNLSINDLKSFRIPLPTIQVQDSLVDEVDKEFRMIEVNKQLITLFEQKIKDKIASVWGE
jgi:type I restriction enzyme M protein